MEPPPLPAALPEDGDELAQLAADVSKPEPERQRAFERLIPIIQWVARRLAVRFTGQQRGDVLAPGFGGTDGERAPPRPSSVGAHPVAQSND